MVRRCSSVVDEHWPNYGGRGITVCERWRNFVEFYADMGDPPSAKHSLDRIDVDGNYEPSNCRWATAIEQSNNKRNNRRLTYNGEIATLTEWSRRVGIGATTITRRLALGWTIEQALTEPTVGTRPKRPDLAAAEAARLDMLAGTDASLPQRRMELHLLGVCQYRHALTDDNTYWAKNHIGNLIRRCRVCTLRHAFRYRARRSAAKATMPAASAIVTD